MRSRTTRLTLPCLLLLLTVPLPAVCEKNVFPADANVVDVTAAPYFAIPDDGLDDTAAINQALADHPDGNFIIYLPNGVYDVSDRLDWPAAPGGGTGIEQDWRYTVLQGQSRDGTVIQLGDSAPGYTDSANPRAVIWTGTGVAQRFRNAVRNLTVDTGSGNPGAVGMRFKANNQGGIFDVLVRSGDGQGFRGIDFAYSNEIGPLLVKNVEVQGFDYGVDIFFNVNSMTFENLTLRNQNIYGLRNLQQSIAIYGLVSENEVPALYGFNQGSYTTVVNATLNGIGGAASQSAIVYGSGLFARNIDTTGYGNAITFLLNGTTPIAQEAGPLVEEFASEQVLRTCDNIERSLDLPVQEAPDVPWGDPLLDWVNIESYGATIDTSGGDDTAAIQAALNDGRPTVYVPASGQFPRSFRMDSDVVVPSHVRRIIGTEGRIGGAGRFLVQTGGDPLVIERFQGFASGVVHDSSRVLVLRHMGLDYEAAASGAGDVFLQDVVGGPWQFNGQRVWGRQINTENDVTNVINNGGDLWILGHKTEKRSTVVETINGGRTEVLGGMLYTTTPTTNDPAYVTIDGSLSVAGVRETNFGSNPYPIVFREQRGAVVSEILQGEAFNGVGGFGAPLYTAYVSAGPNEAPTVDVGLDRSIVLPVDTVALSAVVNDDGLPSGQCRTALQWMLVDGPAAVSFSAPNEPETDVTFTQSGTYTLGLESDDGDLVTLDTLTVYVYEALVTTAAGADGADARISGPAGGTDQNYGGAEGISASNRPSLFSTKAYMRFDLDALPPGPYESAELSLEISTTNSGLIAGWTYSVYGLLEAADYGAGRLDEMWLEGAQDGAPALPGEITFENAPGNLNTNASLDPAFTTLLGSFTLRPRLREVVRLPGSQALGALLNDDSNGIVTLILIRNSSANNVISFAAKENTSGFEAPSLSVVISPDSDGDGLADVVDNCSAVGNAGQSDLDGDGIGDVCDNCPEVAATDLGDDDGDGVGNLCDCAPLDAGAGTPPVVQGLLLSKPVPGGDSAELTWQPRPENDGYRLTRGTLTGLAAGDYGDCFDPSLATAFALDADRPPAAGAFTYLVDGVDDQCGGAGRWQPSSSGLRNNANPAPCP